MGEVDFIAGSISGFLLTFVNGRAQAFINAITPLVAVCVTIWVLIYGIAVLRGQVQDVASDFMWRAIKISIVLALALGIGNYQTLIIPAIYGLRDGLVAASSATGVAGTPTTMYAALDQMNLQGALYTQKVFADGLGALPGGIGKMFIAVLMNVCVGIVMIVNTAFIIIVDVALAFILALGPIFLAALAFPPTAKFFDSWAGKVVNYILLMVLLTMAISLEQTLFTTLIARLDAGYATITLLSAFSAVLLITGALVVVIIQLPNIAAGLAGGSALSGAGQTIANLITGGAAKLASKVSRAGGGASVESPSGGGNIKQGGGAAYQAGRAVGTAAQGAGAAAAAASNLAARTPAYMRAALNRVRK